MDIFEGRSAREKQYELQSLAPRIVKSYPAMHGYLNRQVIPSRAALQQNLQVKPQVELTPALKKKLAKKKRKAKKVRNIRSELAQIKRAQKRFERGERRDPLQPEKEPRLVAEPEQQRGVNINLAGAPGAAAGGAVAAGGGAPVGAAPAAPVPVPVPVAPAPVPPVAVHVGVGQADIDRIRAGVRADVAADIAGVQAEVRRARAAGQQAVQAVGALAPQVRAQRAAAEEAAARAEHVRQGIVEQNVGQAERDLARDAREAERQAAVERGFETLAQDIEERAGAAEQRERQAREQQAAGVEAVRARGEAIAARGEAIHQEVAGQIGGLRAAIDESAGIIQQLRDNPVRDEQQIREEQERYDALTATLAGLNASNEGILATMRGAGGLVRREIGEDIARFDSRAVSQQEELAALGARLEGFESTLAGHRESGAAAAEDLRQRESAAGRSRREEAAAERERRDQEFQQLVEAINDRLGQQDQGIQQTLERVRVSDERRPGEFEQLLRDQIGALEGRLDAGLQEQLAAAIAEGRARREGGGGLDPRDALILAEHDADVRDAAAGEAGVREYGPHGRVQLEGYRGPEGEVGGVGVGTGPPTRVDVGSGPGPIDSDGLNTTLRDSAMQFDPVTMGLGDGNLLTDSQRAAFEAAFKPQRGRGGSGSGSDSPDPDDPFAVEAEGEGEGERDTGRGKKGRKKGKGKGKGKGKKDKGGGTPKLRRTGGGYAPIPPTANERDRSTSRRRSDDFEPPPESTGVGGGKTTGGKKSRGRPKKDYKPPEGRREPVTDSELRTSNDLWEESLGKMGLEADQQGRRSATDNRLKLRLRNRSHGVWGDHIEGEDVVDITGYGQDGRLRLRASADPATGRRGQGRMVDSALIQEGIRRGDLILEKGFREDLGGFYAWSPHSGQAGRAEFETELRRAERETKQRWGTLDPATLRAQGGLTPEEKVIQKLQKALDQERVDEEGRKARREEIRRDELHHAAKIGAVRQDSAEQVAADLAEVEEQARRREESAALSQDQQRSRAQKRLVGRAGQELVGQETFEELPVAEDVEKEEPRELVEAVRQVGMDRPELPERQEEPVARPLLTDD